MLSIITGFILLFILVVTALYIVFSNVPMPKEKKKKIIVNSLMVWVTLGLCTTLFYYLSINSL